MRAKIKICTKCGGEKELSIKEWCRKCCKEYAETLRQKSLRKERTADRKRAYYLAHKKIIAAWHKPYDVWYREQNKEEICIWHKAYTRKHKKKIDAWKKEYSLRNKKKIAAQKKIYNHERMVRIWRGQTKTQKETLMFLRMLLARTEKASKEGNLEALSLLRKKYEQLQIMVA